MSLGAKQAFRTVRHVALVGAACAALSYSLLLVAYSPFQDQVALTTGNITAPTRWPTSTVTWYLNPSTPRNNVNTTSGTTPLTIPQALSNAFNVWQQTQFNGQILNNLTITQGSPDSTVTSPNVNDCLNVIGFSDTLASDFPTGTIAFTQVSTATADGQTASPFSYSVCGKNFTASSASVLLDADMEFNPNQNFSTSTPPLTNNFDLQAIASHEFGHLLGLDHSGIAHAMMFPFGDTGASEERTLATDDVIGISFLYPGTSFAAATGTISGKVTLGGNGIFAAHVVAVDASTGDVVLDGLTNADGTYRLVGVPQGTYNILVLPLAPDVNSGLYTLDDFSGWACGYGENSAPCCDPSTDSTCTGTLTNPTNYTGTFY